ncbi:uncharacterized protein LOC131164824 isoform X3 [Malania oleifera]|uniref:uncharacterized protein LOC131164824 isoform X3 n=1 Tax=Malania oleifera TaxID=397392 RepID=UPI0025ADD0F2|nr:uncharacterized protein LOC131164824 isoform X3 [Malania oleifera]
MDPSTNPETLVSGLGLDQPLSTSCPSSSDAQEEAERDGGEPKPSFNQAEIFKALEVVERDSVAIAESFTSLFASLRLALSEVTSSSVDHVQLFSDAAGRLQESALDAATKGSRYINSCLSVRQLLPIGLCCVFSLTFVKKDVEEERRCAGFSCE